MSNPTQYLVNNTHKGIAAAPLKITAIVGMTLNHVALIFPIPQALAAIFICADMITMPLMCLFIAEGFQHTTNIKRYAGRLFLFTVVSHFTFTYVLSPIGVQTTSCVNGVLPRFF